MLCWGYSGVLQDAGIRKAIKNFDDDGDEDSEDNPYKWVSCENNPKYKIEECDPINSEVEDLIYDAWSMHVTHDSETLNYTDFINLVKNGKPLSDLDRKMLKIDKTFEDWVEILTDKKYRYSSLYPDRKSVADNLLCTIGTGYGLSKQGFIYKEAGGADQNESSYGDWKNAKFRVDIGAKVDRILVIPEVKETIDANYEAVAKFKKEKKDKERKDNSFLLGILRKAGFYKDDEGDISTSEILDRLDDMDLFSSGKKEKKTKYRQYYPISNYSIIYIIGNEESQLREGIEKIDPSYVKASIEICKDIVAHESEEREENVKFAKEFLADQNIEGFKKKEKTDKYQIFNNVKDYFSDFTDNFGTEVDINHIGNSKSDSWCIHMDDTRYSKFGDNNITIYINFGNKQFFKKGTFLDVDILRDKPFYTDLKNSIDRISNVDGVKSVRFFYEYLPPLGYDTPYCHIEVKTNDDNGYTKDCIESDMNFIKDGFEVGKSYIIMPLTKMRLNLVCRKPQPLGSNHMMNTSGKEYFSNSLELMICDLDFQKLFSVNLDERNFNTLVYNVPKEESKKKILDWIVSEFKKMKMSNKSYGTYEHEGNGKTGNQGTKCLYAHDLMIWLRDNQI